MSGYTEDRLVEQPATQLMQHGLETLLRGPWEKGRLHWRCMEGFPSVTLKTGMELAAKERKERKNRYF